MRDILELFNGKQSGLFEMAKELRAIPLPDPDRLPRDFDAARSFPNMANLTEGRQESYLLTGESHLTFRPLRAVRGQRHWLVSLQQPDRLHEPAQRSERLQEPQQLLAQISQCRDARVSN